MKCKPDRSYSFFVQNFNLAPSMVKIVFNMLSIHLKGNTGEVYTFEIDLGKKSSCRRPLEVDWFWKSGVAIFKKVSQSTVWYRRWTDQYWMVMQDFSQIWQRWLAAAAVIFWIPTYISLKIQKMTLLEHLVFIYHLFFANY